MRNKPNIVMLGAVERNCRQVPHATIGAAKIYLNRMQVKYFEKLGLEMWGTLAFLDRVGELVVDVLVTTSKLVIYRRIKITPEEI